jgi:hypothetical protein
MSEVTARPLQVSARLPTKDDADAIGAKLPQYLEPSPYVREKLTGMIHFWQDWMRPLGDVLESCWEAPPQPGIVVANSPLDLAHYGQRVPSSQPVLSPTAQAPAPPVLPATEQSRRPHRKGNKPAAKARAHVGGDGNAG